MSKLTTEQLDRVLTSHKLGQLKFKSQYNKYEPNDSRTGCLVQTIENKLGHFLDDWRTRWFDSNYSNSWSEEEFIQKLRAAEIID